MHACVEDNTALAAVFVFVHGDGKIDKESESSTHFDTIVSRRSKGDTLLMIRMEENRTNTRLSKLISVVAKSTKVRFSPAQRWSGFRYSEQSSYRRCSRCLVV